MATRNFRHHIQEDSSMPLPLRERQAVARELAPRYRKAAKHPPATMDFQSKASNWQSSD